MDREPTRPEPAQESVRYGLRGAKAYAWRLIGLAGAVSLVFGGMAKANLGASAGSGGVVV